MPPDLHLAPWGRLFCCCFSTAFSGPFFVGNPPFWEPSPFYPLWLLPWHAELSICVMCLCVLPVMTLGVFLWMHDKGLHGYDSSVCLSCFQASPEAISFRETVENMEAIEGDDNVHVDNTCYKDASTMVRRFSFICMLFLYPLSMLCYCILSPPEYNRCMPRMMLWSRECCREFHSRNSATVLEKSEIRMCKWCYWISLGSLKLCLLFFFIFIILHANEWIPDQTCCVSGKWKKIREFHWEEQ